MSNPFQKKKGLSEAPDTVEIPPGTMLPECLDLERDVP